jgi:hypothetical protein
MVGDTGIPSHENRYVEDLKAENFWYSEEA